MTNELEILERLDWLAAEGHIGPDMPERVRALLDRAVAAERDLAAARAENEQADRDADAWKGVALAARQGVAEAVAERDAARSQLAEARAELAEWRRADEALPVEPAE